MSALKSAKKPWYTLPWLRSSFQKLSRSSKPEKNLSEKPVLPAVDQTIIPEANSHSNGKNPAIVTEPSKTTVPLPITPDDHNPPNATPIKDSSNFNHLTPKLTIQVQSPPNDGSSKPLGDFVPLPTAVNATASNPPKSPGSRDVVRMVVIGATGVGKTTFINSFKSTFSLNDVGYHALDAGTQNVITTTVGLQDTGKKLVLVDTPGFDDPNRPNAEVLTCIAEYLEDIYRSKKPLDGIIYLHRITDIRFDAGAAGALNIFKKMYGTEGYDKLGLVTTMWNDIRPDMIEKYEDKEEELKKTTWATFLMRDTGKALIARYDATDNETTRKTALDIVTGIMENALPKELKLRIQEELVDQAKKLPRTEAGKAAFTLAETAKYYLNGLAS